MRGLGVSRGGQRESATSVQESGWTQEKTHEIIRASYFLLSKWLHSSESAFLVGRIHHSDFKRLNAAFRTIRAAWAMRTLAETQRKQQRTEHLDFPRSVWLLGRSTDVATSFLRCLLSATRAWTTSVRRCGRSSGSSWTAFKAFKAVEKSNICSFEASEPFSVSKWLRPARGDWCVAWPDEPQGQT